MKTMTMAACVTAAMSLSLASTTPWTATAEPARPVIRIALEDVVTGDWEGTLTIDTPQGSFDLDLAMSLELEGADVTGTFTITGPDGAGEDVDFAGTFDEGESTITGVLTSPDNEGEADVEMEIDGDDVTGTVHVAEGEIEIEMAIAASRVE